MEDVLLLPVRRGEGNFSESGLGSFIDLIGSFGGSISASSSELSLPSPAVRKFLDTCDVFPFVETLEVKWKNQVLTYILYPFMPAVSVHIAL